MKRGNRFADRAVTGKDEWLTPPDILRDLGPFDLDPCAPERRPWAMAKRHFTVRDDGLVKPWRGFVWCNPPYGPAARPFLDRLAAHGHGIALIYARTETQMFFESVWSRATALFFFRGRLTFHNADGSPAAMSAGAPSVLVAFGGGRECLRDYRGRPGHFLELHANPKTLMSKKTKKPKVESITKTPRELALLVAHAAWCGRQEYSIAQLQKDLPFLVFDPASSAKTSWTQEEIDAVVAEKGVFADLLSDE